MCALERGAASPGRRTTIWNLREDAGRPVANGAYFMRLEVGAALEVRRVVVAR